MSMVKFTEYGLTKFPSNYLQNYASFKYTYKVTEDEIVPAADLTDIPNAWKTGYVTILKVEENLIIAIQIPANESEKSVKSFGIFDLDNKLILSGVIDQSLPPGNESSIYVYYNLNSESFQVQIGNYLDFESTTKLAQITRDFYDILESLLPYRPYINNNYVLVKYTDDQPDGLTVHNAYHLQNLTKQEVIDYLSTNASTDPILIINNHIVYYTGENILLIDNSKRIDNKTYTEFQQQVTDTIKFEVQVSNTNRVTQETTGYEVEVVDTNRVGVYDFDTLGSSVDNDTTQEINNATLDTFTDSILLPTGYISVPPLCKLGSKLIASIVLPETPYSDSYEVAWTVNSNMQYSGKFLELDIDTNTYSVGDTISLTATAYDSFKNKSEQFSFDVKVCENDPLVIDSITTPHSYIVENYDCDIYINVRNVDSDDTLTYDLTCVNCPSGVTITQVADNHFTINVSNTTDPSKILLEGSVQSAKYGVTLTKKELFNVVQAPIYLIKLKHYISAFNDNHRGYHIAQRVENSKTYIATLSGISFVTASSVTSFKEFTVTAISSDFNSPILAGNIIVDSTQNIFVFSEKDNINEYFSITIGSQVDTVTSVEKLGNFIYVGTNKGFLRLDTQSDERVVKYLNHENTGNAFIVSNGTSLFTVMDYIIDQNTSSMVVSEIQSDGSILQTREFQFGSVTSIRVIHCNIKENTLYIVLELNDSNGSHYKGIILDTTNWQFDILHEYPGLACIDKPLVYTRPASFISKNTTDDIVISDSSSGYNVKPQNNFPVSSTVDDYVTKVIGDCQVSGFYNWIIVSSVNSGNQIMPDNKYDIRIEGHNAYQLAVDENRSMSPMTEDYVILSQTPLESDFQIHKNLNTEFVFDKIFQY